MSEGLEDDDSEGEPTRVDVDLEGLGRPEQRRYSQDADTVVGPASGSRSKETGTFAGGTRSTTAATPLDTLHFEEIRRTRAFTLIAIPFALVVTALLPFLGGDPVARWVAAAGMGAIIVSGAVLSLVMRRDDGYTVERAMVFGIICVLAGYAGIYFFGVFSPAAAIIPFGLYFFSVGQSYRGTLAIYLMCAVGELGVGGAILGGLVEDRGLIRADGLPVGVRLSVLALVQITFFATFLVARASRKAVLQAIEEHDRVVRGLAQRDELLKEAKQDIERALEVGGLGRFTDEVVGSFRLGSVIGRGGMGEVYDAVHLETEAVAAVKLLPGHALGDPDNVRRFLREAKIAASFDVPNVVRVLEIGGLEARVPFIAMERLRGQDLAEILREHRRLSIQMVLVLVREIGAGLDAARRGGIVHRDLKPRNLFCAEAGGGRSAWKILDFGVSRLLADQATLTRDQVIGTPSYMAPEQIRGGKVDHRTDLYALGVICYRALTGRPAFVGDQMPEILHKVLSVMPSRPSSSARLAGDLDLALALAMAKDPGDRFDTATQLADALEAGARGALAEPLRARATKVLEALPWSDG